MTLRSISRTLLLCASAIAFSAPAYGQTLRIPLPKRAKATPVQNYNREGVNALKKHDYKKAKKLFYKAYLLDPNDPFTLNNLGYIAELEGKVDRAQRFYDLSASMKSDAQVDKSTADDMKGKQVTLVAGHFDQGPMEVNKLNIQAIGFLTKDRPHEANTLLESALKLDAKNPFTLNNLGYDMEEQGELQKAADYYTQSANQHSDERIIVAVKKDWRGKRISEIAAGNAERVLKAMQSSNTPQEQVALLNLRGVSALNRNERVAARTFFEQAYKADPENAFALNNMGYIAEQNGDRETAQVYYEKAQAAERANRRVTVASDPKEEGKRLTAVASNSDQLVEARMNAEAAARRASSRGVGSIRLGNRGYSKTPPASERMNEPVIAPPEETTPTPSETTPNPNAPSGNVAPATENATPAATQPQTAPANSGPPPATTQPSATPPPTPVPQEKDPVPAPPE